MSFALVVVVRDISIVVGIIRASVRILALKLANKKTFCNFALVITNIKDEAE